MNGTALDFVQHSPDDERLKIINGIAAGRPISLPIKSHELTRFLQGLEYLHAENIIHGDLRGVSCERWLETKNSQLSRFPC
jgi:serine/threonine protein kinase